MDYLNVKIIIFWKLEASKKLDIVKLTVKIYLDVELVFGRKNIEDHSLTRLSGIAGLGQNAGDQVCWQKLKHDKIMT